MRLFLGIDGGGTGCRAALADAEGRILGQGEGGPANIVSDHDGALSSVLAASRAAFAAAGLGEEALAGTRAVLGLAGSNLPEAVAAFSARLPFAQAQVLQDADTALEGALGPQDGILAALGTGTVFGRRLEGERRFIGGWGFVLGDEGGGAWIGRALMARALHATDGLVPMTPLLETLLAEEGGPARMVETARTAAPARFGLRARLAAERPDDPAAAHVLAAADAEILRQIDHLQPADRLPVTFTGGLGPLFAARLAPRLGAPVRPPAGTALDGALALARALQ